MNWLLGWIYLALIFLAPVALFLGLSTAVTAIAHKAWREGLLCLFTLALYFVGVAWAYTLMTDSR